MEVRRKKEEEQALRQMEIDRAAAEKLQVLATLNRMTLALMPLNPAPFVLKAKVIMPLIVTTYLILAFVLMKSIQITLALMPLAVSTLDLVTLLLTTFI
jgi:hypothetical protein